MKMKEVAAIVVTYNRLELLKECIAALRGQTYKDVDIIIVNNGSTDGTKDYLDSQKDLIVIHQENCGGAGGFFTGMKYASEEGIKFCWIMDDDVICKPDALSELVKAYNAKKDIGFVCSKVEGINGSAMNTPTVDTRVTSSGYACYYDLIDKQMIKVRIATFVSVFLPTSIIFEIGLPIKEFFIWGDDSEYTQRISKQRDCYMACKSIVVHKRAIQGSLNFFSETNEKRLSNYFYMFRNNDYVALKDMSSKKKLKWLIRKSILLLKLLLKFDFKRFKICWKAATALISFNPKIYYPNKSLR